MTGRIIKADNDKVKLPIIGKVKCGEKRNNPKTGKDYPISLDHFIGFGKYQSYFDKAYPDKPNRIQIIFVSNDPEQSCNERYELRNDKGDLYGSGNGKSFMIWDGKEYKPYEVNGNGDKEYLKQVSKDCKSPKGWEVILTLQFIMPAIRGVLGLWQFSTKGKASSVNAIRDTFDFVQVKAGSVLNIVFDLMVEKVQSQKPDDPSVYPVVSLICNVSEENLQLAKGFLESGKAFPKLTDEVIEQNKGLLESGNEVKSNASTSAELHKEVAEAKQQAYPGGNNRKLKDAVDYYTNMVKEAKEKGNIKLEKEMQSNLDEAENRYNEVKK